MQLSDRRLARRFRVAKPLRFSVWNSSTPEIVVESINISERGTYFERFFRRTWGQRFECGSRCQKKSPGQPRRNGYALPKWFALWPLKITSIKLASESGLSFTRSSLSRPSNRDSHEDCVCRSEWGLASSREIV